MRFIALSLVVLGLTGCAGAYTNQASTQIQTATQKEEQAWGESTRRAKEECGGYDKPSDVPPEKAVEVNQCLTKLIQQIVMPSAAFPDLILTSRAETLRNAEAYATGKISKYEWDARAQEISARYIQEWNRRAYGHYQNAAQQDQILAQQQQQYFQNLSKQLQEDEIEQRNSMPQQTNCHVFGSNMNCTTW